MRVTDGGGGSRGRLGLRLDLLRLGLDLGLRLGGRLTAWSPFSSSEPGLATTTASTATASAATTNMIRWVLDIAGGRAARPCPPLRTLSGDARKGSAPGGACLAVGLGAVGAGGEVGSPSARQAIACSLER